jgi:dinuclear metal center YbgI/SA1388 family protein
MQLNELLTVLEEIAPTKYAEAWDNVGLLVGDPVQHIFKVLLTIDYTPEVAAEGMHGGCDVIVAYHPPIFEGLKRITAGSLIHDAIRRGVAIWSPHTALDVAEGGTNDMLADVLGLEERQPLRPAAGKAGYCKLVVFVPPEAVEPVASALFEAGAGRIGNYNCCSFRSPGTGTFYGEEGARPAVGQAQRLERVEELKLEMVLPLERVGAAVKALRQAHPYEEPAFDLVQLAMPPEGKGQGRIGMFASPVPREELFDRIKRELVVEHLLIAGPSTGPVVRAAVCAGSCGDLLNDAIAQGADLYLTGEVRHHDALKAAQRGLTVVCALHSNSERAVLKRVARRIEQRLPGLGVRVSGKDRDPFVIA